MNNFTLTTAGRFKTFIPLTLALVALLCCANGSLTAQDCTFNKNLNREGENGSIINETATVGNIGISGPPFTASYAPYSIPYAEIIDITSTVEVELCYASAFAPAEDGEFVIFISNTLFDSDVVLTESPDGGATTCGVLSVSGALVEADISADGDIDLIFTAFGEGWETGSLFIAAVNQVTFDYSIEDNINDPGILCQGDGSFSFFGGPRTDDIILPTSEVFDIIPFTATFDPVTATLDVDNTPPGDYAIIYRARTEPNFFRPAGNEEGNEPCERTITRVFTVFPAFDATIDDVELACATTGYDLRNLFTEETSADAGTFSLTTPQDGASINGTFLTYTGAGCVDVTYTIDNACGVLSDDAMVFFPEAVAPSFRDTSSLNCWTGEDPLPLGVVVTSPQYSVTPDYLWEVDEDQTTGVTVTITDETTASPTIILTDGEMNSYGEIRLCFTESITTTDCGEEEECERTFCRNLTVTIFDCNEACNSFQEPGGQLCPVETNDFFEFTIFGQTIRFGNPDTALVASTVVAGEFIDPADPGLGGTLPPFISCTQEEIQVSWDFGLNEDALPPEGDDFFDGSLQDEIPGITELCDISMFPIPIPEGACFRGLNDDCDVPTDDDDVCAGPICIRIDQFMPFSFLNFAIPGTVADPGSNSNEGVRLCEATPRQLILDPLRALIDATASGVTWADTDGDGAFDTELLAEGLNPDGGQPSQGTAFVPNNIQGEGTIRVRNLASSVLSTYSPCISPPALNLLDYLPIDAIPIAGPIIATVLAAGGADVNIVPAAVDDLPIRVVNDQNPEFLNFPDQYVFSSSGDCSTAVNWSTPIAIDGCTRIVIEDVVQTGGPASGSILATPNPDSVGTDNPNVYEVEYTATACNEQDTTMTFRILISDGDPVIRCPEDITVINDVDQCSRVVTGITPLSGIGCNSTVTWTAPGATPDSGTGDASGTTFPVGETTVTYTLTFTDENGMEQMSSCDFVVTVEDGQKPDVACTDFEIRLDETGMAVVTTLNIDGGSTDNCTLPDNLDISLARAGSTEFGDTVTFDCFEEGQNTVVLRVIDEAMNESRCLALVTVTDFFEEYTVTLDVPEICLEQPSAEQLDFSNYLTISDPQGNVISHEGELNDGDLVVGLFGISSFVSSEPGVVATIGTSPENPGVVGYLNPATGEYTPGSGTGFVTITYVLSIAGQITPGPSGFEGCFTLTTDVFELRQPLEMESPECACIVQNDRIVDLGEISGGLEPYTIQYGGVKLDFDNDGIADDVDGEFTYSGTLAGSNDTVLLTVDSSDFVQDLGQLLVDYTVPTWFFTVVDARGCELFRSGSCDNVDLDGDPEVLCEDLGPMTLTTDGNVCSAQYTWTHPLPTDNCDVIIYNFTITNPDGSIEGPFDLVPLLNPNAPAPDPSLSQGNYDFQFINPDQGLSTVTYYAEDAVGNFTTCSFTVTVADDDPPFFLNCPEPAVVVDAIEDQCVAYANYSLPLASDNCSVAVVTQVDTTGLSSGDLYPVGITINTFEAVDPSGNTTRCDVKVIVNDIFMPPTFDCPDDVVTTTDPGDCGAVVDGIAPGEIMDNCIDNVTTIFQITDEDGNVVASGFDDASGFFFDLGVSTVRYAAQDMPLLLITEVTQAIGDPVDGTEPIPAYAAGIPPSEDFLEVTNFNSAVLDVSCLTIERFSALGIDTFAVPTFTLLEPGGTLVIHFGDGVDSPADNFFNDSGAPDLDPTEPAAYVISLSGEVLDVVAINGYDLTGLDAAAGFDGSIFVEYGAGIIRTTVFDTDTAADFVAGEACNPTTIGMLNPQLAQPTPNGAQTAIQAQPIVRVECEPFTVTVTDDEPAVCGLYSDYLDFTVGPIVVEFGECVQTTIITVTDDIDIADVNFSIVGDAGDLGNLTISLISPEGTEVDFVEATCAGVSNVDVTFDAEADGSVADNCGSLGVGDSLVPIGNLDDFNGESALGDWIVQIGHNGGESMATANFTSATLSISDREAYVQQDTTLENDLGVCGADFTFLEAILFDNCPGGDVVRDIIFEDGTLLQSDTIGILGENTEFTFFFPVGTSTVRFTLTDAAGNVSSCEFDVEVLDTEDPVLVCPGDTTIQLASGECDIVYIPTDFTATDNCAVTEIFSVPDFNQPLPIGVNEVMFTIRDAAGNDTTCTYTVTVLENIPMPPVMACITDINVHLGPSCEQEIIPQMLLTGNDFFCFDNYIVTLLQENAAGGFDTLPTNFVGIDQVGQNVRYVVTEPRNDISCWGNIEVGFFEAPILVCPADTTVSCNADTDVALLGMPEVISCAAAGAVVTFADTLERMEICDDPRAILFRTWLVTDAFGNAGSCVQTITIEAFDLMDIRFPEDLDDVANPALSCVAVANDPSLTDPINTGFPTVADGGNIFENNFCSASFLFEDQVFEICDGSFEIIRTWLVRNTCQPIIPGVNPREGVQLIRVLDAANPILTCPDSVTVSTGPFGCDGTYAVPPPQVEAGCSGFTYTVTSSAGILTQLPDGTFVLSNLEIGTHSIRYEVEDGCGRYSECIYFITVTDQVDAFAICEDGLNVSLNSNGTAQLLAADVDGGSSDLCGTVDLSIRRTYVFDAVTCDLLAEPVLTDFGPSVDVNCCDLDSLVNVELRVVDADGNASTCWTSVLVEDKLAPICVAPNPVTVTCADLEQDFPQDLNVLFATDPTGAAALLDASFGVATGVDNCPDGLVMTQNVLDTRNSCGVGTIQRFFTFTDTNNALLLSSTCSQVIEVIGVNDYTIVFSGDQESDDCIQPDYNGVTFTEIGCDLITVATAIDTFTATADECYKLRITYQILNWCEYNATDDAYLIPRDADGDNVLDMDSTVLHVIPRGLGPEDDLAFLDRDVNRDNFNTIANLDTGDGGILPGTAPAGYGLDGSRGAFTYEQFIKVFDDTPPTLTIMAPDSAFCSFNTDCTGDAEIFYAILDECSPASVNAILELDLFIDDTNGDYTLADFVADEDVSTDASVLGEGNFSLLLENLAIGRHALRIRATDGCGNTAIDLLVFEIEDCKAPTPICINGLTATLMPDGDGGGMAAIWANDFIASPSTDCSGPVKFAIYLDGEQPSNPSPADTGLLLNCDHLGPQTVRLYAIDAAGQSDYCLTSLMVQAFTPGVCGVGGDASLAGAVMTPASEMMNGVTVNISAGGGITASTNTTNGIYVFTDLITGEDYTVEPNHDPAVSLSRITTGDLISISRHILGLQDLTDNYQLLAADVTQDDNINVLDIIGIRRVILGLDEGFQFTPSWRFYLSGDAGNSQVYTENNLEGNVVVPGFMAVEMGNVNGTPLSFNGATEARQRMGLQVTDRDLKAGNTYRIDFSAEQLSGFQGTLELRSGLEIQELTFAAMEAGNFNLNHLAEGLVAMSYHGEAGQLFTLEVRATTDGRLSDLLLIGHRITRAEAYLTNEEVTDLSLDFGPAEQDDLAGFELLQNSPNPFTKATRIGFLLSNEGFATSVDQKATLHFHDQTGRLLRALEIDAVNGLNELTVTKAELGNVSGVITYTVVVGPYTATRMMVVQ